MSRVVTPGTHRDRSFAFSSAFTLIELAIIVSMMSLAAVGAVLFERHLDIRYARLIGAAVGFSVMPAMLVVYSLFESLFVRGIPEFRHCRNSKCQHGRDYDLERHGEGFVWVCRCGDGYDRIGRRFMHVTDAGERVPYMRWVPFKGWCSDKERAASVSH
jgi:hypothetical protein